MFLASHIETELTAGDKLLVSKGLPPISNRHSKKYFINEKRVCQTFFEKCLGISSGVYDWMFKHKMSATGEVIPYDNRGNNTDLKLAKEHVTFIQEMANKLPRYKSHFTTKDTEYWHPLLTYMRMYKMYKDEKNLKHPDWRTVSNVTYKHYLNQKFGHVKVYLPRKDRCKQCTTYTDKIKIRMTAAAREKLEQEHQEHLQRNNEVIILYYKIKNLLK